MIVEIPRNRRIRYQERDQKTRRTGNLRAVQINVSDYSVIESVAVYFGIPVTSLIRMIATAFRDEAFAKEIEIVRPPSKGGTFCRWSVGFAAAHENIYLAKMWAISTTSVNKIDAGQMGAVYIWLSSKVTQKTTKAEFLELLDKAIYETSRKEDFTPPLAYDNDINNLE